MKKKEIQLISTDFLKILKNKNLFFLEGLGVILIERITTSHKVLFG